jgi:hypothetical protein
MRKRIISRLLVLVLFGASLITLGRPTHAAMAFAPDCPPDPAGIQAFCAVLSVSEATCSEATCKCESGPVVHPCTWNGLVCFTNINPCEM